VGARDTIAPRLLIEGGTEQERERQQEAQVDRADLARLPHARVGGPDVEEGGQDRPAPDRPAYRPREPPHRAATSAGRLRDRRARRRGAAARWPAARRPWDRSP